MKTTTFEFQIWAQKDITSSVTYWYNGSTYLLERKKANTLSYLLERRKSVPNATKLEISYCQRNAVLNHISKLDWQ